MCVDDVGRILKMWSSDWVSCEKQHTEVCTGTRYIVHSKRIYVFGCRSWNNF